MAAGVRPGRPRFLTVSEAADELGLDPATLRREIHAGALAAIRIALEDTGGRYLVPAQAVDQRLCLPQPVEEPADRVRQAYSVAQAAGLLRVSAHMLRRACRAGVFPAVKFRAQYRVPAWVIDDMENAALQSSCLVDAAEWVGRRDGAA
jgi:excisionase family DNA binding protein